MNLGPILNGYRNCSKNKINIACVRIKNSRHELRRATCSTLQCVHKCIEDDGDIFENLL
jgi:hypothetical protein